MDRTVMKTTKRIRNAAVASGMIVLITLSTVTPSAQKNVRGTVDRNIHIRLIQPCVVTTGDNTFEVAVEGSDGKAINDVDVSVSFVKAAWPIKRIPETRNDLTLRSAGDGRYSATWNVSMAGQWQTTVIVKRDGAKIGRKSFVLVAY